jgi:hypothetical protein
MRLCYSVRESPETEPMNVSHLRSFSLLLVATALLAACEDDPWDPTDPPHTWDAWDPCTGLDEAYPHPRPDLRRQACQSLDGAWSFRLDPDDVGLAEGWASAGAPFPDTIQVPFPWTSPLSGVTAATGDAGGVGWYRREVIVVPQILMGSSRVHLVVGAADWHTTVFVNGVEVATHDNGYLPLRADLTKALVPGANTIVLRVADPGNHEEYPHGKQGTPWYANVAGVWQTVYLELSGPTVITHLGLRPVPDRVGDFTLEARVQGKLAGCALRLYREGSDTPLLRQKVTGTTVTATVSVPDLRPWSPEDPALLALEARLTCFGGEDVVRTVTGWRTVERASVPGQDFEAIHLNGAPVYVRGVLVQGYDPQGLYTYPDRDRIRADLQAAKDAGYNLVRLHLKVEDPLVLDLADRLGLLVSYDVPSYGIYPFSTGDTAAARQRWQETFDGMVDRDGNHPSILWWTLWNEDWGLESADSPYSEEQQAFVRTTVAHARERDPSRLVEDHSTLREDHVAGTDVNSFHLYAESGASFEEGLLPFVEGAFAGSTHNFVAGDAQDGAPLLCTEYGPFSYELLPEWRADRDVSWGLRVLTDVLRRHLPLTGYVFTQLYDVEFEHNGLLDYDRTLKEPGYPQGLGTADLNAAEHVGFVEPHFQVDRGATLAVTPFVSRWAADLPGDAGIVRLTLFDAHDAAQGAPVAAPVTVERYAVTVLDPVTIPADLAGAAYVLVEWLTDDGTPLARGYLPGEIVDRAPAALPCDDGECTVAIDLGACTGDVDPDTVATVDGAVHATGFLGAGVLTCTVAVPLALQDATDVQVSFAAEAAANVRGAPQTTAAALPGAVDVAVDGASLGWLDLPPDRADSRGVLSHLNGPSPAGGWGVVRSTALSVVPGPLGASVVLRFSASGDAANGLVLYGRRMGRYGVVPTLLIWRGPSP